MAKAEFDDDARTRKLIKTTVEALPSPATGQVRYFDSELDGFGVTVLASGKRKFFVRFWQNGRRVFLTLGTFGEVTVEQARKLAEKAKGAASLGKEPKAELGLQRKADVESMPTFGKWRTEYLEGLEGKRKSLPMIRYFLEKRCPRRWSSIPLDQMTERDVAAVFQARQKTPAAANRWLATLGACFNAARRRRLIPYSPCEGIEFYAENPPRSRTYTDEELGRLWAAIAAEPDLYVGAALRLQLETGARIGEVLKARWEDIDMRSATWRLPSPKAGKPQTIFLHERTVAWLKKLPVAGPFLIPGRDPKEPRHDFKRAWRRVREAAQLPVDCRTHDIRRTFGRAVAEESGLHMASRMLRHADVRITAKVYAPLDHVEIRAAVAKALPAVTVDPKEDK